jgi:translation elongation factor P/translation initiation factor 5A
MQTVTPSEFKKGMTLMLDGVPHVVGDFHATGAAKTRQKLHARLRNLMTGRLVDRSFIETGERIRVDTEQRKHLVRETTDKEH